MCLGYTHIHYKVVLLYGKSDNLNTNTHIHYEEIMKYVTARISNVQIQYEWVWDMHQLLQIADAAQQHFDILNNY